MAPQQKSGIAVGINKGHITTRRELKQKPSQRRVCNGWIHPVDRWMDGWMDDDEYSQLISTTTTPFTLTRLLASAPLSFAASSVKLPVSLPTNAVLWN